MLASHIYSMEELLWRALEEHRGRRFMDEEDAFATLSLTIIVAAETIFAAGAPGTQGEASGETSSCS
jgi:hypothetical protein